MQELVKELRSIASRGKRKFRRILKPPKPRVVWLPSDDDLFSSIEPDAALIAEGFDAWRKEHASPAKSMLVEHFRARRDPRFFCDPESVHWAMAQTDSPWKEWHEARKDRVARELAGAVSVYSSAAQIGSGEQWRNLPAGPGGDILYPERPHRFDFAPSLALASLTCAEAEGQLEQILSAWCQASYGTPNPVAYISTHLCVYRIIALAWVHAFLRAKPPEEPGLEVLLLKILLADLRHVAGRISRTVANNHLLADSFALWFGGTLYPEFRESTAWREAGNAIWLRELERQIYPDGCSIEHSSHYQEHVLELLAAYVILSRLNGQEPPQWVVDRFERMLNFQCRLGGPEAVPWALGDTTEDPLFPLDTDRAWGMAAWRELHANFFPDNTATVDPRAPSRERAYWLLGGKFSAGQQALVYPSFEAFPDGGYYVLSDGNERTRLIFRTGPRKELPLRTGHMHSDLLSIYLSVEGKKLICESGTYTYRSNIEKWPDGAPAWRQHFLGTRSANGLEIFGVDALDRGPGDFPSGQGEDGVASFVQETLAVHGPGLTAVEARTVGHNAYHGHHRGVIHVVDKYWLVYDDLTALERPLNAALNFQLAPGAAVHRSDHDRFDVTLGDVGFSMTAVAGTSTPVVLEGDVDPIAGWVSRAYGIVEPAPLLRYELKSGTDLHALLLCPDLGLNDDANLQCSFGEERSLLLQLETADCVDYLVLTRGGDPEETETQAFGLSVRCRLCWLRLRNGELEEVRFLDLHSLDAPAMGLSLQAKHAPVSSAVQFNAGEIIGRDTLEQEVLVRWQPATLN